MTARLILLLFFLVLGACTPATGIGDTSDRKPRSDAAELDFDGFLAALRANGAEVTSSGSFTSAGLTGEPRLIHVGDEAIQVYVYESASTAATEAAYFSPDGGSLTIPDPANPEVIQVHMISWIGTPHLYQSGRLIVQYIGDNAALITLLDSLLGSQIAGRVSESKPDLLVGIIELAEGAPMSFTEAVAQAEMVILGEVVDVVPGPNWIGNVEIPICLPSQLITMTVLKSYKGPLTAGQEHTLYQEAGLTDMGTGCGDDPTAADVIKIMEHDPLYDVNQRYLLALRPRSAVPDPDPAIAEANAEHTRIVSSLAASSVLFNGRLLVEQGGLPSLAQADVVATAYDDYGRAIPGQPTGLSLGQYEAQIATWMEGGGAPDTDSPDEVAARALHDFLTLLHEGDFAAAADFYAGDYEWLREVNPDISGDDVAALLARGCQQNGLVCLGVAAIESVSTSGERFEFAVQFATADGGILALGPCCGEEEGEPQDTFTYHVVNRDGRYLVEDLPPYQP